MIRFLPLGLVFAFGHAWAQPSITTLNPVSVLVDSGAFTLTVQGGVFNACSKVRWDGVEQPTTFVNTGSLTAAIPATLVTTPRAAAITVIAYANTSPPCGNPGQASTPRDFFISARPMAWDTASALPNGSLGVSYQTSLLAVFGVSPIAYALLPGSAAPPGLTLNSNGNLTGIPTQAGSFGFAARATSGCAAQTGFCVPETISRQFTITIGGAPLSITTQSLPAAIACSNYSATLAASGGAGGYVWSSTTLPAGLGINAQTGVLSGVVLTAGTPQFAISVRDQANVTVSRSFVLQVGASTLAITTASLPGGAVGSAYSASLAASGGVAPYIFAAASDVVPGLTTSLSGAITGTPQVGGTFNTLFRVTDSNSCIATRVLPIPVQATPLSITTQQLPQAFAGETYGVQLAAAGGSGQRTWSLASGNLPSGLSLNPSTGLLSGTPSASGTFPLEIRVTDSASATATRAFSLLVIAALTITTEALPSAAACGNYSATVAATGGVAPYIWSATGLPTGFSINSQTGLISGAISAAGSFTVAVSVRDQAKETPASRSFTLTLTASALAIATASLPAASFNTAYSTTLSASGGLAPFVFSLASNPVPGLTVAGSGNISGIPTQAGLFDSAYRVTDAQSCVATRTLPLQVIGGQLSIVTAALPPARLGQPYLFQLSALGGSGARSWIVSSGTLPFGLSMDSTSGVISGTPLAAGESSFQITVTDGTSTPAGRFFALTVSSALSFVTEILPPASQGQPYSFTLLAAGGTPPLRFSSFDLPQGLTVSSDGFLTGTPILQGTFPVTFQVADATGQSASKSLTLTINSELRIVSEALAAGQTGAFYNQTISAAGGRPPYAFAVIAPPSIPRGLTLDSSTGQLTGTPSEAGDFSIRFRVTDQNNTQAERPLRLTIRSSFSITTESLPAAGVNEAYIATLQASDGRAPLRWSIENATPSGLSLDAASGTLSGAPTTAGVFTLNLLAVDASGLEARKALTLTVRGRLQITPPSLAPGEVGVEYRQGVTVSGTQTAASLLVSSGALPDGLRLEGLDLAANIIGTPARAGTFAFSLRATDAAGLAVIQNYTLRISERLVISTASVPSGAVASFLTFALAAAGGEAPFTWSLSAGSLPAGLQLDAQTGVISGSPTQDGPFNFTVQVRDSDGRQTTRALSLRVLPVLSLAPASLAAATLGVPYSQSLTTDRGNGALTFALVQGPLPSGLTLNTATGVIAGVPRAFGQFSFTVGVTDSDGARGNRAYAISVAALAIPGLVIGPETASAAQQQQVSVALGSSLPADVDGLVRLSFVSEDGGPADPALRLSSPDGQTAAFRVPAGQTQAAFPAGLSLQTGTVAGAITLTLDLTANGVPVTPSPAPVRVIRIPRGVPVIDSVAARRSGNNVTVEIVAFATGREVTSAEFQFTSSSGLTQNSFTVQTTAVVSAWYQDARSREFGSLFRLTMPFVITPDAAPLTQVSVTLVNSTGRSQSRQAAIQ